MPAPLTPCLHLRKKFRAYCSASLNSTKAVIPIEDRASFARELDVKNGQVTQWLDGRQDSQPDRLPSHVLGWLVEQLTILTDGRVGREHALDLWRYRTFEEFSRQLRQIDEHDFLALLDKESPQLCVSVAIIEPGLGMFEEPFEPLEDEHVLHLCDKIRFEIQPLRRGCLIVLASSPTDWYWLTPSEYHPGMISGGQEMVPAQGGFTVLTSGPHRIVAIELNCHSAPYVRKREEPLRLTEHQSQLLAEEMGHRSWRWGEARFFSSSE